MLDAHFTRQQALQRWSELFDQLDKSSASERHSESSLMRTMPDQHHPSSILCRYPGLIPGAPGSFLTLSEMIVVSCITCWLSSAWFAMSRSMRSPSACSFLRSVCSSLMRLSISLSEVRDSWRSRLPRCSPDIPPLLLSPAGDPDCAIWNSAVSDGEGSLAPRTVCGAEYLRGREAFSLRVSSCIVPSPNSPPIMGPSNRIANYRVREPGNSYQMIELFGLLQVGHSKTDHFLLPVVVR
jgi:hypothetical protein